MKRHPSMYSPYFESIKKIKNSLKKKYFIFGKKEIQYLMNEKNNQDCSKIRNSINELGTRNLKKNKLQNSKNRYDKLSIRSSIYSHLAKAIYRKIKIETAKSKKISTFFNAQTFILGLKTPDRNVKEEICLNLNMHQNNHKLDSKLINSETSVQLPDDNYVEPLSKKRNSSNFKFKKIINKKTTNLSLNEKNIKFPEIYQSKDEPYQMLENDLIDLTKKKKYIYINKQKPKIQFDRLINFNMIEYMNNSLKKAKIKDKPITEFKKQVSFKS